eukprot:783193-Ditylum_brightwellii.AAC.2
MDMSPIGFSSDTEQDGGNDDNFDTFGGATVTASVDVSPIYSDIEIPVADNAEKENENQNSVNFGDFGPSNAATESEEENQNDDNFGDFGTANEAAEPSGVDVCPADSDVEIPLVNNIEQDGRNDDNFGDFRICDEADEPAITDLSPIDFAVEIPVSTCNAIFK